VAATVLGTISEILAQNTSPALIVGLEGIFAAMNNKSVQILGKELTDTGAAFRETSEKNWKGYKVPRGGSGALEMLQLESEREAREFEERMSSIRFMTLQNWIKTERMEEEVSQRQAERWLFGSE